MTEEPSRSEDAPFAFSAYCASWEQMSRRVGEACLVWFEAFKPTVIALGDLIKGHPELLAREEGPEPADCYHLCGYAPEHQCTAEAVTSVAYRPGGRLVPMCGPCRDVVVGVAAGV